MTLYAALLGQAWNILGGFGGQFSFGHAVFFGTGAYAAAVLQVQVRLERLGWRCRPAVALGAAVGAFVGALSFRYGLRGSYFALVTLAFAEVFRILANTFQFTGAGVGLMMPLRRVGGQLPVRLARRLPLRDPRLRAGRPARSPGGCKHSRYGAWLQAVRDNEESAAALGVNVFRVKLGAIMHLGRAHGARAACSTCSTSTTSTRTSPTARRSRSRRCSAPIVGGMGTLFGPLLGRRGAASARRTHAQPDRRRARASA